MFTDDPIADARRHDKEQQDWLNRLPRCGICGKPIQDEHYYCINDENVCPECLEDEFRKENIDREW